MKCIFPLSSVNAYDYWGSIVRTNNFSAYLTFINSDIMTHTVSVRGIDVSTVYKFVSYFVNGFVEIVILSESHSSMF